MTCLVIGSSAMAWYLPGVRAPKDFDVFAPHAVRDAEVFWHPSFSDWIYEGTNRNASLDELYTIKVSHAYWDLHGTWNKHMYDVVELKKAGARLMPWLHDLLYAVWVETHGAKRLNLNKEADEFFSDAVRRLYVHDSIHDSVAYGDQPLYERILKDGASVAMDMSRVWELSFADQVRLFREEVYVTALERLIIPNDYKYSPRRAYAWALKRTITSLTKGRSARFIVENFDVFRTPDVDYVARHRENSHRLILLEA